jgi:hypothetical protein
MANSSADRITNCARVLLALTKDWQAADGNAATLSDARAMLARTIYATDGDGFPNPASDELVKQSDLQDAWKACVAAARTGLSDSGEPYAAYGSYVVLWTADPSNPAKVGDVEGLGLSWPIQPDSHMSRVSGPIVDGPQGKPKRLFFFDAIAEEVAIENDGGAAPGLWPRTQIKAAAAPRGFGQLTAAALARPRWATAMFILWILSGIGLALGMWCLGAFMHPTAGQNPTGAVGRLLKLLWSGQELSLVLPLICTMVSMAILMLAAGLAWKGLWFGVLVDERNRISMSRVQQVAWTILLLSGVIVMAWFNAALMGGPDAANAGFELFPSMVGQLWAALGINLAVTPILSSAILDSKAAPQQGQTQLGLRSFVRPAALDTNPSPSEYSWLDLVTGETTDTENQLDVGRIQHLVISGGLLTTYFMALIGWLDHIPGSAVTDAIANHKALFADMPGVGSGTFVGLLAVSHAGYLAFKARDGASPTTNASGSVSTQNT